MPVQAEPLKRSSHEGSASARPASTSAAPIFAASPAVQRLQETGRALNARAEVVAQRALGETLSDAAARRVSANRTGLPDGLKTGVEALSGLSLDDVRVHRNSGKPAALQAHAYAQGTDIHVAPGQERHLPHEAWHVVQQKQARVKPTMQMTGVAINDDVGLEHEANVMGARAAGHRADPAETEAVQRAALDGGPGVVQRAVGFEWEVDSIKLHEVTEARDREQPTELPSKAVAFRRGGVRLEVDSGHGEFVTEPAETMNQLEAQLSIIKEVIGDLSSAANGTLYMKAPGVIVYTDDTGDVDTKLGESWMEKGGWIRVSTTSGAFSGTFQATSGIDFTPDALLAELRAAVSLTSRHERDGWEQVFTAAGKAADAAIGAGTRTLIIAVEYFIAACRDGNPGAEDGPKTWMPLLLRTDFRAMFEALDLVQQQEFKGWASHRANAYLCPKGYSANGEHQQGPTIREWLASMCNVQGGGREADKDMMSPPPGFKRHLTREAMKADAEQGEPVANPIPYAMGLYGLDGGKIIGERRSMAKQGGLKSGRVTFEEMAGLAREFALSHGLQVIDVAPPESLPEFDDSAVEYLDDDDRYVPPVEGMEEEDSLNLPKLREGRNWYKRLCDDAKETVGRYGKGMFDYGELRGDQDDLGSTRLTPEHYALFDEIRKRRPDLPLDPPLLAHVFERYTDVEERIGVYADIQDSL